MVSFRNRPESVPLQLKQPVRVVKWISTVKSWRWTNTATLALNGWSQRGTLVYYVFDLLMLDGKDLRLLPLMKRKERLARLLTGHPRLLEVEHIERDGLAMAAGGSWAGRYHCQGCQEPCVEGPGVQKIKNREYQRKEKVEFRQKGQRVSN